jgi:hypothetical protein
MKPIKYKQEQIDAWLTEWRSSGLNAYQFSLGKPFYPSTFLNWVRKSGEHTVKDKSSSFIRVDVQTPELSPKLVIHYPNGVKIELNYELDVVQLKSLAGC